MDAGGLALGIPAFVVACFKTLERVELYKSFGVVSRQLVARFETCKLQLQEWADESGISDGGLKEEHHARLDDPEVARVVRILLASIQEVFEKSEDTRARSHLLPGQSSSYDLLISGNREKSDAKVSQGSRSKWRGVAWAMKGKDQYNGQVEMLEVLMDKLFKIVPTTASERASRKADAEILSDVSAQLSEKVGNFERDLTIQLEGMKRSFTQQAYKAIDEWLDTTKVDQQYEKHINDRLEGTCEWIFNHDAYQNWMSEDYANGKPRFLWVSGPAGHGKSVLCARIFQVLKESDVRPSAYFSSTSHVQAGGHPNEIVRFWLSHLARSNQNVFDIIWAGLQSKPESIKASSSESWSIFKDVASHLNNCALFLDGLDEYSHVEGRRNFLRKLKKTLSETDTQCLIASRVENDIELELGAVVNQTSQQALLECRVTQDKVQPDVNLYSQKMVIERLPRKDKFFQLELAADMAAKCEGMFLWIKLHQGQLRGGKGQKELRNIVKRMPTGLNQSYDRNWANIQNLPDVDRDRAVSILRWITFSLRPLTVGELAEALAVELDIQSAAFPFDALPNDIDDDYINEEVKLLCGSLIEIRSTPDQTHPSDQTIHLVHISVKEYLVSTLPMPLRNTTLSTSSTQIGRQHDHLMTVCLQYLGFTEVWSRLRKVGKGEQSHPFCIYAIYFWYKHKNSTTHQIESVVNRINEFFLPNNSCFRHWIAWHKTRKDQDRSNWITHIKEFDESYYAQASMYYASKLGLTFTMRYLYDQGYTDINLVRGLRGTALQAACASGQREAFELLIHWGADVNKENCEFGSAIIAAAARGDLYMTTSLIDKEANLMSHDSLGWTPLHFAADNGHFEVVQLLLENGADAFTADDMEQTPLFRAAHNGHLETVKLLLENGADASTADEAGWTPIMGAARCGHSGIVQLLLNKGADVFSAQADGWTPLNMAARNGHSNIVQLLLKEDTKMSADNAGMTPLHSAARHGHLDIVGLLLNNGAKIQGTSKHGWTPLDLAARHGHLDIVRLLLKNNATISTAIESGRTPLHSAISLGHSEIVRLLLNNGANISTTTKSGWTPLHLAAAHDHLDMVSLLLHKGATMPAKNNVWTPLHSAAKRGNLDMAELLIKSGGNICANEYGWTPLHIAAGNGHLEMVELLLGEGADVSYSHDVGTGEAPLHVAATKGHAEVVNLLLTKGAQVNQVDNFYSTALHVAVSNNRNDCVDILVEAGADLASIDGYGKTPLDWMKLGGSGFEKYVKSSAKEAQFSDKIQHIRDLAKRTLESVEKPSKRPVRFNNFAFSKLGRRYLHLEMFDEAVMAFHQGIIGFTVTGVPYYSAACDNCNKQPIQGTRWVCRTCPDVDLCMGCGERRPKKMFSNGFCQSHEFFSVPTPKYGPTETNSRIKDKKTELLNRWSQLDMEQVQKTESERNTFAQVVGKEIQ